MGNPQVASRPSVAESQRVGSQPNPTQDNAGDEFGTLVVDTRWDDDEVVHVYNRSRSRVHDRLYPPGPWRHRGQISNPDSLLPY